MSKFKHYESALPTAATVSKATLNNDLSGNTNQQQQYSADMSQIEKFVDALFPYAMNGVVSLRSFYHSSDKPALYKNWTWPNALDNAAITTQASKLATLTANSKQGAVFCPPVATFKDSSSATESNLCEGVALSIDIDEGDIQKNVDLLISVIGQPTVIVNSGGSVIDKETGESQNKVHLHWRLVEPTETPEEHARLKEARMLATAIIGADATNVPLVHPIRWPGSWHTKNKAVLCSISHISESSEIHLSDTLEALQLYAPKDVANTAKNTTEQRKNKPTDYIECQDNIRNGVDYHHSLVRLSAKRAHSGMNEHDIVEELQSLMDTSEAPRDERWQTRYNDISRLVRSAMKFKVETPTDDSIAELFDMVVASEPQNGWIIQPYNLDGDPDLSHDQLALELSTAGFKNDARFVAVWGKWLLWDCSRWVKDDRLRHMTAVRDFLRAKATQLKKWGEKKAACAETEKQAKAILKFANENARNMRQAGSVNAVETMTRSNAEIIATAEQFDSNLMLLGTPTGTVDLSTGELMKPERSHWITKHCKVSPAKKGTPAPLWEAFLKRTFDGNNELIEFMQRAAGYALTGHTTEHKLLFMFGTGSNGKSVFLNTIFSIMGDYAKRAAAQTFLNSSGDKHPTDLAGLQGARLVAGSELPAGKAWNESVIKDLTGGDIITARFMRQDYFDYMPQFTLFIAGNHRPSFSGIDEAIRRRVCLIPFTVTIPKEERDPELPQKLEDEWPAILRWMIDGALEWQRIGLSVPEEVSAASQEYMEDEDTLSEFFADNIADIPFGEAEVAHVYERFKKWQRFTGASKIWSKKAMSGAFSEMGIKADRGTGGKRVYKGWQLKPEPIHYQSTFFSFNDSPD